MALPRDIANSGDRPLTIADEQKRGELQLAKDHASGRNRLIVHVFGYLSVMRAAGLIAAHDQVRVSPDSLAVPQDFQASRGNQAAHYLPGFVAIHNAARGLQYLWDYATDPHAREEIVSLFRATQDLPASYNRADSAAEGRARFGPAGLKQIFQQCCQMVVDEAPLRSKGSSEVFVCINRPLVKKAWTHWAVESKSAYERASAGKDTRTVVGRPADVHMEPRWDPATNSRAWGPGDPAARIRDLERTVSGRTGSVGEFQDQASFLRIYGNVTSTEIVLPESVFREIENRFAPRNPVLA